MIRKFYETEGLEMKGANTPHPSTPAGKEEADSVIDRDSLDTNCLLFPIAVKKWWDNDTQCWGYTNEEYNISGYGKTEKEAYDMFLDCVSDVLVFVPPSPQSEQAGEKVFITGVREGFSGWQAWFKIDHQTFYLQPVTEINDVENTQERAKWYEQNLIIALTRLLTKH